MKHRSHRLRNSIKGKWKMMTQVYADKSARPSSTEKMQVLMESMDKMAGKELPDTQTVADDSPMPPELQQKIMQYETVVREVLAIFGLNYDDMIRMDNKSPYAQAVAANPAILQQVALSENPVLSALKIAAAFQPYTQFVEKYGSKPDEIEAAIRKQVLAEMQNKAEEQASTHQEKSRRSAVFSGNGFGVSREGIGQAAALKDIFNGAL